MIALIFQLLRKNLVAWNRFFSIAFQIIKWFPSLSNFNSKMFWRSWDSIFICPKNDFACRFCEFVQRVRPDWGTLLADTVLFYYIYCRILIHILILNQSHFTGVVMPTTGWSNSMKGQVFWVTIKSRAVDRSTIQFWTLRAKGHST